jgi:hypothetical protein
VHGGTPGHYWADAAFQIAGKQVRRERNAEETKRDGEKKTKGGGSEGRENRMKRREKRKAPSPWPPWCGEKRGAFTRLLVYSVWVSVVGRERRGALTGRLV